jgi:hypothetical protein
MGKNSYANRIAALEKEITILREYENFERDVRSPGTTLAILNAGAGEIADEAEWIKGETDSLDKLYAVPEARIRRKISKITENARHMLAALDAFERAQLFFREGNTTIAEYLASKAERAEEAA